MVTFNIMLRSLLGAGKREEVACSADQTGRQKYHKSEDHGTCGGVMAGDCTPHLRTLFHVLFRSNLSWPPITQFFGRARTSRRQRVPQTAWVTGVGQHRTGSNTTQDGFWDRIPSYQPGSKLFTYSPLLRTLYNPYVIPYKEFVILAHMLGTCEEPRSIELSLRPPCVYGVEYGII